MIEKPDLYSLDNISLLPNSPLKGKRIIFLGSSVTEGSSAGNISFVEYISKRNGCICIKEAVSGTTLVDIGEESYIKRLRKININEKVDIFVCQLSTNDASLHMPLGNVDDVDLNTVTGSIKYIYKYVKEKWHCPFVMFSNPFYEDEYYKQMVKRVKELDYIHLIDMYFNQDFNDIDSNKKSLYMADSIHPTKKGYLEWWTPLFEEELSKLIK